ncbi:putative alkaline shock family protein YloU [Actinomadura pelletieri DSM 43383]|uniref:Putative alkaline shock family protein YloU n=1 Tax=Actinomadura pelletieri DSM 43383 TaxID=1120940 RepID=A0A495QTR9_9ACTN|nr:Asp23/Gls24 family envelope stress response protein [Actinomadura pelletieri]RKS76827.1 putative alkaline shock family protein YloU [Actinomadura pelletieri DSM 43383]
MSQDDAPGPFWGGVGKPRWKGVGRRGRFLPPGGQTRISGAVVAKVAAMAAGDVHGSGTAVRGAHVRGRGPRTAVDIDLLVRSGPSGPDLTGAVRDTVVTEVEHMCGLEAAEVNVTVDDVRVRAGYPEEPHVR